MQTAAPKWVNPSVLREARERLGLSPNDVERFSRKLGGLYTPVEADELQQWEDGTAEPELEHLETLSELYVCPVGHFFLPKLPLEPLPLSFRGLSAEKGDKLGPLSQQTLLRFLEMAKWAIFILEDQGVEWKVKIQPGGHLLDTDILVQQEKKKMGYSSSIRAGWASAEEAFLWWRKKIEEQGIFCFQMKLEPGDIRGASAWLESRYPFILVNHQDVETTAGRLFTLLHEYAHLITADEGIICDFRGRDQGKGSEPSANQFAARMLLSFDELEERLDEIEIEGYNETWPDDLLDEIRKPFFVSRDVIVIALQEMKLAPESFYQKKRAQWDKRKLGGGGRGKNPTKQERTLREIGFSLARILSRADRESAIPWADLSYMLDMKVEKIPEFLNWVRREVHSPK